MVELAEIKARSHTRTGLDRWGVAAASARLQGRIFSNLVRLYGSLTGVLVPRYWYTDILSFQQRLVVGRIDELHLNRLTEEWKSFRLK